MIKIVYHTNIADRSDEEKWLREQKVFPSIIESWDHEHNKPVTSFAMIVEPEVAVLIKLRHNLDLQTKYSVRVLKR